MITEALVYALIVGGCFLFVLSGRPRGLTRMHELDSARIANANRKKDRRC